MYTINLWLTLFLFGCDETHFGEPGALDGAEADGDCDGLVDEGVIHTYYRDLDKDGYGQAVVQACTPAVGKVEAGGDCDDRDYSVSPGAVEVCDDIDNNCDGLIDDEDPMLDLSTAWVWYVDKDGDGYGSPSADTRACWTPSGYASNAMDCDDTDSSTYPGAPETCDSLTDLNCNGIINGALEECTEGYWGQHEMLLDYDKTKTVSCDTVWTDVGISISPCPSCVWSFEVYSTFEPSLSTDGGIVGDSCYAYTGSADYTWSLGLDLDFYGYGVAYLWYYDTYLSDWYPLAYASVDSSGVYLDWKRQDNYFYQYPYAGYYFTYALQGSATVP